MTTIIRAAHAAEFLALVPRIAGFRPTRSVVFVPFHGNRTLGVMRIDLPTHETEVDSVAATLIGMVCKVREADGAAIVVYTDEPCAGTGSDDGALAHTGLVRALTRKADACGLRIADALCVATDGWGSYFDRACPPVRHPLEDLADESVLEVLPEDMRGHLGDQSAGAELPERSPADLEHTGRALKVLAAAIEAVCGATGTEDAARADLAGLDPQALAAACALEDVPALFEDALEWDAAAMRPFDAAAVIWCLARPALRDIALVQWCAGIESGDAAFVAQLRWEDGEEYPEHLAAHLWGDGPRPDPDRLIRALELARHAAALAPTNQRPGSLATAGWLCWALGRSTHAAWYAEQATAIEPEHGLSSILLTMISAGHLPEWAFDRSSVRRPRAKAI